MAGLTVTLQLQGRRCLVVGGGPVGLRRTRALLEAGAQVTVVAIAPDPRLADLPCTLHRRPYTSSDMSSVFLTVIATDDPSVNAQAQADAAAEGALVNRADAPAESDLGFLATATKGPVTLAVHTGNTSAAAAKTIRDELIAALDPDWATLLEAAQPFRVMIQQAYTGQARFTRLVALTDDRAMRTLKQQGPDALHAYLHALAHDAPTSDLPEPPTP